MTMTLDVIHGNPLLEPSADELRSHIGSYFGMDSPLPDLNGTTGKLIYVAEGPAVWVDSQGEVHDYGIVPWLCTDEGWSVAVVPGTTIAFTSANEDLAVA